MCAPGWSQKIMLPDVHNRSPAAPPSTRDMPEIAFTTRTGEVVAFDGRNKRRSRRSPAQIRKRMRKLKMSPKMIARAVELRKNRRPSR